MLLEDIFAFADVFSGWWSVMTQAAFSFIGTEIVAVRHVFPSHFSRELFAHCFELLDCCW